MAQNQDKQTLLQPKLCIKCTNMYGHPNFEDMCSICFKKQKAQQKLEQQIHLEKQLQVQKKQKQEIPVQAQIELDSKKRILSTQTKQEKNTGKCATCYRKTKLLGYTCKHCDKDFCRMHRLPEEHECIVDFVSLGKKKIKTQNPNITHKKIEQI